MEEEEERKGKGIMQKESKTWKENLPSYTDYHFEFLHVIYFGFFTINFKFYLKIKYFSFLLF